MNHLTLVLQGDFHDEKVVATIIGRGRRLRLNGRDAAFLAALAHWHKFGEVLSDESASRYYSGYARPQKGVDNLRHRHIKSKFGEVNCLFERVRGIGYRLREEVVVLRRPLPAGEGPVAPLPASDKIDQLAGLRRVA